MIKYQKYCRISFILMLFLLMSVFLAPQVGIGTNEKNTNPGDNDGSSDSDSSDMEKSQAKMTKETGKLILESGDFSIEINAKGEVPYYHFNTSVDEAKFFLKFESIIQYNDSDEDGLYDKSEQVGGQLSSLSLASVDWDLEILTDTEETKEFAFISSDIHQDGYENTSLALINHFSAGDAALKFDINISEYPFVSEASNLCLEFSLKWSRASRENDTESQRLIKESTEDSITLTNEDDITLVYFEMVNDIIVDNQTISDGAKLSDTAPDNASQVNIYINYPKFTQYVYHDPIIGTSEDALVNPSAIDGFMILTVIATIFMGAVIILQKRHKTKLN